MKKNTILFASALCFYGLASAQITQINYNRDCAYIKQGDLSQAPAPTHTGTYTLPVVVHVWGKIYLSSRGEESLSLTYDSYGRVLTDEKIQEIIHETNELLQGRIYSPADVFPAFQNIKENIQVELKLAQKDVTGKPITGIVHHAPLPSGQTFVPHAVMKDAAIRVQWNTARYLNLHIVPMPEAAFGGVGGYATVPWQVNDLGDFIVISGTQFLESELLHEGKAEQNKASLASFTIAHELGHYLGLPHTFGFTNDGVCGQKPNPDCFFDGDYVWDTPAEDGNPLTHGFLRQVERHGLALKNCRGEVINVENIMGYYVGYGKMFTAGQVQRMRKVLESFHIRRPLWQAANLRATGLPNDETASILPQSTYRIHEDPDRNDGSIQKQIVISLDHAQFNALPDGQSDYAYTIDNTPPGPNAKQFTALPQGITLSIRPLAGSPTKALITIAGRVNAHDQANSGFVILRLNQNNVTLAPGISTFQNEIAIHFHFLDPYRIRHTIANNVLHKLDNIMPASESEIPTILGLDAFQSFAKYIRLGQTTKVRLYTRGGMLCEPGTRNIALLSENTLIAESSPWASGSSLAKTFRVGITAKQQDNQVLALPKLDYTLSSPQYQAWNGVETGYAGFSFLRGGEDGQPATRHYGWLKFEVNAEGNYKYEYAYNTQPGGAITAGQKEVNPFNLRSDFILSTGVNWQQPLIATSFGVRYTGHRLENAPKGMDIDNNLINWTPTPAQTGTHLVVVLADTDQGDTAAQVLTMHVLKPIKTVTLAGNEVYPQSLPGALVGTIVTNGEPQFPVRHELIPPSASFVIRGDKLYTSPAASFDAAAQPQYTIGLRSRNAVNEQRSEFTIDVVTTAQFPQWQPIDPMTIKELRTLQIDVSRYVSGDQLSYRLENPPYGMQIDESTGQLTWTPAEFQAPRSYDVQVSATPAGTRFTAAQTLSISVEQTNSTPRILPIGDKTAISEQESIFTLIAQDRDLPRQTLSFTLDKDSENKGMALHPVGQELAYIFWKPADDHQQDKPHKVTVSVTDSEGARKSVHFTVLVEKENLPPNAIALSNTTVAEGSPAGTLVGILSAVDENPNDKHVYSWGKLIAGTNDHWRFMIRNDSLLTAAEDLPLYAAYVLNIRASDRAAVDYQKAMTHTQEFVVEVVPSDNVLALEEPQDGLSISPVPTAGWLELHLKNAAKGEVHIRLKNLSGQQVQAWTKTTAQGAQGAQGAWKSSIDIGHLPRGVYMIDIIADDRRWIRKIVKH